MTGASRVSIAELLADLVFVCALTQLSALLAADPDGTGVLQTVLIFLTLYWMHSAYVWATNQRPAERRSRQLLVYCGIVAMLVCALATPDAFGEAGDVFGVGYLLVTLVYAALHRQAYGPGMPWFALFHIGSALLVIAAGFVPQPWSYAVWVAAVAAHTLPRVLHVLPAQLALSTDALVERYGVLLLLAFGQSVFAIAITVDSARLGLEQVVIMVLALVLAAALVAPYFLSDADPAMHRLGAAGANLAQRAALIGYFGSFSPMLLGVVVLTAGVRHYLAEPADAPAIAAAVALGGGAALYLAGALAYRWSLGLGPTGWRLIAAVLSLFTVPLGIATTATAQLGALAILLGGLVVAETRIGLRSPAT